MVIFAIASEDWPQCLYLRSSCQD